MRADAAIRTPDQRLRVFVSSTLGEMAEERHAVSRAISALRLTPVLFELGARPHPPRDLYRAYLAQSDVFIGLYWQRYGQIVPGMEISGLEEEFQLSAGLPRLLYVKAPAPEREPRLAQLLARVRNEASYRRFQTPAELGRLVRDDLAALLSERFAAARPPPAAAPPKSRGPSRLPVGTTSLLGRAQAIDEVASLLERPDVRLVTLTGPGGVGKTRLALAVAERLGDRFAGSSVFVQLAPVTQPERALAGIARAVGADLAGTDAPLEVLVEQVGDGEWLLILDNLEQVVEVAGDLGELLARCPGMAIVATSRTVLGLRAEREYVVPPLPLPADPTTTRVEELSASSAVALFVDRARSVHPHFALTEGNAWAVAEICRRLEGLPLAIELAAARTRLLDPEALLGRLATSLDALGKGTADMPARQHTLRATVEWSVGLLEEAERSLLEVVAVFADGWTIDAAADVAGLDEDRALDLTEALARHSLIYLDTTGTGTGTGTGLGPRPRMLETIREFVAERLAARPDVAEIGRRHADHYRALGEQADGPLRGVGQKPWVERLQAEAGNLAAAVGWYLVNDPAPLPHMFRVLWPFWSQWDHLDEARAWIEQLLPTARSLDPHARAELLWAAAVTAREVGDDRAALAARKRLAPLMEGTNDPYLHAASQLAMSWTSPIVGDLDGALREALAALEEFQGQDEPLGTASASLTVGSLETSVGRHDDALRHLTEARDLAARLDNAWLDATSRVLLGILALTRGRTDEAGAELDEGLDLSLAAHSTQLVSLSLTVVARLAFVNGDVEWAAMLAGAAEGLRRRVGLRVWPSHRRGAAELEAELRRALGAQRFQRAFAAGTRLNRRQAVAAVRDRRGAGAAAS
jgi:predicted ATPase